MEPAGSSCEKAGVETASKAAADRINFMGAKLISALFACKPRSGSEAPNGYCCIPEMMLMSGMKRAITIVPTTTARKTIITGSSMEVRPATALSTSSS